MEGPRDLLGAPSDWDWGRPGCCCGHGGSQVSHFSDGTLFAVLAAGALAFYVLYSTITMAMGAGNGADPAANGFFRVKRNSASTFPTSEVTSDSSLADRILRGSGSCLSHGYF